MATLFLPRLWLCASLTPALLCRFFVLGIVSKSRKVSAGVTRPRRNQVLQDQQAKETLLWKARARARAQLTKGEPPPRPSRDTPRPRPGHTAGSASQQVCAVQGPGLRGSHGPELQPGGLSPGPASPRPLVPPASPRPAADLRLGHRSPPGRVQVAGGRAAGGRMRYACAHLELSFAAAKRRSHPNRPIVARLLGQVVETPELRES